MTKRGTMAYDGNESTEEDVYEAGAQVNLADGWRVRAESWRGEVPRSDRK